MRLILGLIVKLSRPYDRSTELSLICSQGGWCSKEETSCQKKLSSWVLTSSTLYWMGSIASLSYWICGGIGGHNQGEAPFCSLITLPANRCLQSQNRPEWIKQKKKWINTFPHICLFLYELIRLNNSNSVNPMQCARKTRKEQRKTTT